MKISLTRDNKTLVDLFALRPATDDTIEAVQVQINVSAGRNSIQRIGRWARE